MKLLFCILAIAIAATAEEKSLQQYLQEANDQFGARLFNEVTRQHPGESVICSPFSVLTPLAQLSLTSDGQTHVELLNTIGLPNDNVTKEVFSQLKGKSIKGVTLNMANKIYVAKSYELNDEFAAVTKQVFDSEVQNINFVESNKAAAEINSWVENHTNNRIKDLVSPDSLDQDTRAILVNAIYFKGTWKEKFYKEATTSRTFYVTKDNKVTVDMMFREGKFLYGESRELNAKLIEIPYEGDEASFMVILPNEIEGLSELQSKLANKDMIKKAESEMFYTEVQLFLPKFKIETETDLLTALQNMNLKTIFSPEAQLSKLLKVPQNLYVSKATQKAFIEVNEEGAEAAAANDMGLQNYSAYLGRIFVANKPFYFGIKSKSSQVYIFTGVYAGY